LSLNKTLM